jgi:hypothetical protein
MYMGKPKRVVLTVDLRRYHSHLVPGTRGTLLPDVKVGMWGHQDRFGAVRFDCCGATLDVLFESLDESPEEPNGPGNQPKSAPSRSPKSRRRSKGSGADR